jgi:hypothetical protein
VPPPPPATPAPVTPTPAASVAASVTNSGRSSVTDADISVVDAQLKGKYDGLMDLQKQGKGTSDEAKGMLKAIEDLQAKRNDMVQKLGH